MISHVAHRARAAVLSSAIAACFVPVDAAATAEGGALHFVTNCNDSGPGSLRDTVASAVSGDSIDLAQMGCSVLTLTTGAIVVPQDDLAIKYTSAVRRPTISGDYHGRVFTHTGSGTLELDNLDIQQGKYLSTAGDAFGGCINSSAGRVVLNRSVITHCLAVSTAGNAGGGGIYARDVRVYNSSIISNRAQSYENPNFYTESDGGGVHATIGTISYSTIANNQASGDFAIGGGLCFIMTTGSTVIDHSLIAFNESSVTAGGIHLQSDGAATVQLVDSTVYANQAGLLAGGINFFQMTAEIRSATIADNHSLSHDTHESGVPAINAYSTTTVLSSSIVSNNVTDDLPNDGQMAATITSIFVDHGLVFGPPGIALPADTLTVDPLLLPMTDNGGSTQTMAIRAESPAVDQGIASDGLTADQRGPGFARLVGAAVDIGAFERQGPDDGDRIMIGGFDPP